MELDHLNTHQVHQVARFYAAAAIATRGHKVEIVGPMTRLKVDGRVVRVLSRRQPGSPWQANVNRPATEDAEAVVFVDLTGDVPDYYVAPASWVEQDVRTHHEQWLARIGGERPRNPDSDHTAVPVERLEQWHRRWDVLRDD
jgi:hypothetical protein